MVNSSGIGEGELHPFQEQSKASTRRDLRLSHTCACFDRVCRQAPTTTSIEFPATFAVISITGFTGSPAYFAQRGKPKTPDDLVAHDCIRIRFSSGTYVPWRFRVKRRDLEVHVEGRLVVNSVTVARRAAIEGLALVQGPPVFIASDLAEGRLVTALDEWAPTPATGFFLYYPSRRQMRPALKAFLDFLRKERHGA